VISRRTFGLGLLGSAALVAVGGALAFVDLEQVVEAATEACFPPSSGLPTPSSVAAGHQVLAYVAQLPADVQLQAKAMFRSLEWLTLPSHGQRFSQLSVEQRTAVLADYAGSRWFARRLLAHSIKQTCAVGYWQSPQTWAYLGYDGPLVGRTP